MRLLTDKLLDSVQRHADACAIKHGATQLSFADLARRAGNVARWLVQNGVRPGDRVALLIDSSAEYVVAYYAILMSGGVAVALNAAARAEDFAGWITHSGARALIADGRHAEAVRLSRLLDEQLVVLAVGGRAFPGCAGDFESVASHSAGRVALPKPEPQQLAALLYTSGTTGHPKAVMLSHANLAANTDSIVEYLALSPADSVMCVLPFYYSYGNSVLHTHIAVGARIVIEHNLVYPHVVVEQMAAERVTGLAGVPATFALLEARVAFEKYDLSALRYLTQAGGPMSPALSGRVRALLPQARLFVMYGQTEATARLSYLPPERLQDKSGSVGIGIRGVDLEVRGTSGEPLPVGVTGEVWARGPNVMLGYWRDADATREVLIDGWLRTGDAGYLDAEGFLFLEGRRSDIIKVGAHRVFPLDIEAVIEELDGVQEVAVVGIDDPVLGQTVKACVVRSADKPPVTESAIKGHCRARLAAYKVPKIIEFVATLPRTSSGKVRRKLLLSNVPEAATS